ncbi:hypothetical protein GCM10020001_105270 [Nonomuraea salmonea]
MKPWTNVLYVSLIIRCDSAAIVPKTSELLPDPDTPREHRQPALRDLDADVLEVVDAGAVHADEVVGVGGVGRGRLGVRARGHAVGVSICLMGAAAGRAV